jgi:hypothetical protein
MKTIRFIRLLTLPWLVLANFVASTAHQLLLSRRLNEPGQALD